MPQTPIYLFSVPDDTASAEMDTLVADAVQSIEDNLPHRYAATITALNAMSGTMYPNGMIALLTADSSGVVAGSSFVRAGSKWLFNTGSTTDITTFVAALTGNVGTMPGASFYDQASGTSRIFTNTTGNSEVLLGGSTWTNITYATGYKNTMYGDPLSYRLVPGGAQIRGHIMRSNGKAIAKGAIIGNIPSAARPSNGQFFVASAGGNGLGNMLIQADGDIYLQSPIERSSSWYSLDNVFLAKN